MADNLFHNILRDSKAKIPLPVLKSFKESFPNAINIEWCCVHSIYEAVFYDNDFEKIIRMDKKGERIDLKVNLPLHLLPVIIYRVASKEGEIMNAISITEENTVRYELIIRDKKLNRYLALYSDTSELINKNLL